MSSIDLTSITDDATYSQDDGVLHPIKLFGRENELIVLKDALNRIKNSNSFETVMIHGMSGTGKTSLVVTAMQEAILDDQDLFFCGGKYFQNTALTLEPHSAFVAAFSDLCDLTLQASDYDEENRLEIQRNLGAEGCLLRNSVTNISHFLPNGTDDHSDHTHDDINKEFALAKFNIACKKFLCAMASSKHPVVIFIDDIQWMDNQSQQLIQYLIGSTDIQHVLLILAYRDEEAEYVTSILSNYDQKYSEKNKSHSVNIPIKNLDLNSISQMLTTQFDDDKGEIQGLSALIHRKTEGNPFHVIEFLSLIQQEELLYFDEKRSKWTFDLEIIQKRLMVSDTLGKLILSKVGHLDEDTQTMLKIASFLGYRFQKAMLVQVLIDYFRNNSRKVDFSIDEESYIVGSLLKNAERMQFLEQVGNEYQFSHDKIQASFQQLVEPNEQEIIHIMIAEKYLNDEGDDSSKYRATIHVKWAFTIHSELGKNGLPPFTMKQLDYVELARLYFTASDYCKLRSGFLEARYLLQDGLALLKHGDDLRREEICDLEYEMSISLSKMEFIIGNLDASKSLIDTILLKTNSMERKTSSLAMKVELHFTMNELTPKIGKKVLKQLGIKIPRVITLYGIIRKIRRMRNIIDNKTDEDILSLPLLKDPQLWTTMGIMIQVVNSSLHLQAMNDAVYLALIATELSLKVGLSSHSADAFNICGIAELISGSIDRAYRLGQLSLKLLSHIQSKDVRTVGVSTAAFCLLSQKERLRNLWDLFPKPFNNAFDVGDVLSIIQSLVAFFNIRFWAGDNLSALEIAMRNMYHRFHELGHNDIGTIKPLVQMVWNLQHCDVEYWKDVTMLNGQFMNEKEYPSAHLSNNKDCYIAIFQICKMFILQEFAYYEEAENICEKLSHGGHPLTKITCVSLPFHFYYSIISYRRYRTSGARKYIRIARKCRKFLVKQQHANNPNALPYLRILDVAELNLKEAHNATAAKKIINASNLAIETQKEERLFHLEALANEQAGFMLGELGFNDAANEYYTEAIKLYQNKWGATKKSEWLKAFCEYKMTKSFEGDSDLGSKKKNIIPYEVAVSPSSNSPTIDDDTKS